MFARCRTPISRVMIVAAMVIGGLELGLSNAFQQQQVPTGRVDGAKDTSTAAVSTANHAEKELFSGKVVMLQEALKRRGVKALDEFKSQVVLESDDGELIPIVPDWRGRAFYQDERLRNRRVDLVGTRQKAAPYLQVLMIFVFDDQGTRQYMDYWCDVCSIPMYEIKPCDCCQMEIRLRLQMQELPSFVKKRKPSP